MRLMKGLHQQRNGIWRVRVAIPADVRAHLGLREYVVSLGTTDKNEAIRSGAPLIADIKKRIEAARNPAAPPTPVVQRPPARRSREEVFEAIQTWRHEEIDALYREHWNDEATELDPVETSRLRYALQHNSTIDQITHFTTRLGPGRND